MISAVFFMNAKGEVIVSRIYRDDISRGVANAFRIEVTQSKVPIRSPVTLIGDTSFCHIRVGGVYIVSVSHKNVDAAMVFTLLYRLVDIFKSYFDGDFDEEAIKKHFTLVYELLDEILDFGYPQNASAEVLQQYITQGKSKVIKNEKANKKHGGITAIVTGEIPWRDPNVSYRKNEVFFDVIESVNLLMSAEGNVLRADVSGQVVMKTHLTGMPECKFGMNDSVSMDKEGAIIKKKGKGHGIAIDDCTFHQCVKLGKFDQDRTVSFVPPDGEFVLMQYRTTENIHLPFRVLPIVKEIGRSRVEYSLTVKANFNAKMLATGVTLHIPTPKNTAVCKVYCNNGRAKYQPDKAGIIWKIRRFPGETEASLRAEVELISATSLEKKAWSRPPITMEFQVPMYTSSGFHVRFLKVIERKLNYATIKWVRYVTKAGHFQIRI